jgi:hypothetical protein
VGVVHAHNDQVHVLLLRNVQNRFPDFAALEHILRMAPKPGVGGNDVKRRSAKHLEFSSAFLEGRRTIQLSYGRFQVVDYKPFANASGSSIGLLRRGRRSIGDHVANADALGFTQRWRSGCLGLASKKRRKKSRSEHGDKREKCAKDEPIARAILPASFCCKNQDSQQ